MLDNPKKIERYLIDNKLLDDNEAVEIFPLSGGVSSLVWKIKSPLKNWVLKQSLAVLKVKTEWISDVNRIVREFQSMHYITPLLHDRVIPKIVFDDPENHLYVMESAPDDAIPWKKQLLNGHTDLEVAVKVAFLLKMIHEKSTLLSSEEKTNLQDMIYFDELRIQPFHYFVIGQFPQIRDRVMELVQDLTERRECFVHGDFSPKNILVDRFRNVTLLDFEVAHWGNPVMDIAFVTSHLLLKGIALKRRSQFYSLIEALLNEYGQVGDLFLPHVGLLMLARIRGKSPVEYVTDGEMKERICELSLRLIQKNVRLSPVRAIEQLMKDGR